MERSGETSGVSDSLAQLLRQQILTGKWQPGASLPSTRQLAREHRVSINTVQGVLRELSAQGLVDLRPRRGGFVKTSLPVNSGPEKARSTQIGILRPLTSDALNQERDNWSSHIIRAIEQVVLTHDCQLSLLGYVSHEDDWLKQLRSRIDRVATDLTGVICFATPGIEDVLADLDRRDIPWISINRPTETSSHNFVMADNLHGGRLLGRIFARMGFERVIILTSDLNASGSSFAKITGLLQGYVLERKPVRGIEIVTCDDWHEPAAYQCVTDHLSKADAPQAFFCSGDLLAIGALRACQEAGLCVPDDLSIVGSTGLEVGSYTRPALTCLAQPMTEMGRRVGQMLLQMIHEGLCQLPGERIPSRLILRETLRLTDEIRMELIDEGSVG